MKGCRSVWCTILDMIKAGFIIIIITIIVIITIMVCARNTYGRNTYRYSSLSPSSWSSSSQVGGWHRPAQFLINRSTLHLGTAAFRLRSTWLRFAQHWFNFGQSWLIVVMEEVVVKFSLLVGKPGIYLFLKEYLKIIRILFWTQDCLPWQPWNWTFNRTNMAQRFKFLYVEFKSMW